MKNSKNRGQGLVEFALILPILLMLLLGIAEGAHIIQAYLSAQAAVRETARYAIAGQPLKPPVTGNPTWGLSGRYDNIMNYAEWHAAAPGSSAVFTQTNEFDTGLLDTCDDACAGMVGIRLGKENPDYNESDPNSVEWLWGEPGREGENIRAELYHNVAFFDPIYEVIVPNGYFTIRAAIVMRNEGGPPLSGTPTPYGTLTPPAPPPTGQPSDDPIIYTQDASYPAGATAIFILEKHTPNTSFDIYVDGIHVGSTATDPAGLAYFSYPIPSYFTPGGYTIESRLAGASVAINTLVVTYSENPLIVVDGGDVWPLGSHIEYYLNAHQPNVITTPYRIELYEKGGPKIADLSPLTTDASGNSPEPPGSYDIPHNGSVSAGKYVIQSVLTTTAVATRELTFTDGCIKLNQGNCGEQITQPNGVDVNVLLERHAYSRTYIVKFNGIVANANVATDQEGKAFLRVHIPDNMPDGTYNVTSHDAANPGVTIATTPLRVLTPPDAFIHVDGGYTWPAGTTILFQLRDHLPNTRYDLYWRDTTTSDNPILIIDDPLATADANGRVWLDYTIPISIQGTYRLQSRLNPSTVADPFAAESNDITVTPSPYLLIAEGNTQIPGAPITILLRNHAINTQYDLYIGSGEPDDEPGIKLPQSPETTDGDGNGEVAYTIPVNFPTGQSIRIRTYPKDNTTNPTAETLLELVAADLVVESIVPPDNPTINGPVVLTITIRNNAPVTITHKSFDVDVYLDPINPIEIERTLPPGNTKAWLQPPFPANGSATFTTTLDIYGAQPHEIWGRVDTSDRIAEVSENNNLNSIILQPSSCAAVFRSSTFSENNVQYYGDADPGISTAPQPRIRLTSAGGNTNTNNDNAGGSGHYLAHQVMTGTVAPSIPPDVINFNDHTVSSYGGSQDQGIHEIQDSGVTLYLSGNAWKKIDFAYSVTADTVLEFDFKSTTRGEIHGIGFDSNNSISSNWTFELYGTQNWGLQTYHNYAGSDWVHYVIPVGQHYTGAFNYLFFVNDDDSSSSAEGYFRNVKVYEDITTAPPTVDFEMGTLAGVGDTWQTVTLSNDYGNNMVVIASVNYSNSDAPAVTRVRNAQNSSFEVKVQNPGDSTALSGYAIHYIVVREGVYNTTDHGVKMEAVKFNSTRTAAKGRWGNSYVENRSYSNSYSNPPVVLGQVMTENDPDWSVFWARGNSQSVPPSNSDLRISKHVAEDSDKTRANETIGYLVIESGSGQINSANFVAGLGMDTVRGVTNSPPYNYSFSGLSSPSVAIVSAAAMDGGDGGWPILYGANPIGASQLALAFDEDQISNSERGHTTEQVAYIVFENTNRPPVANAGQDQAVAPNTPVTLDGSGSSDPNGDTLDYAWTQLSGPSVTINNANQEQANFTPTQVGIYQFELTVDDGEFTDSDTVYVVVTASGSGPSEFEIQVRLLATDTTVTGEWGLEIREETGGGSDAKVSLGYNSASGQLQVVSRSNSGAPTLTAIQAAPHPGDTPSWLRIVKQGATIELYTAGDDGNGGHQAWGSAAQTLSMNDLHGNVMAGLYSSSNNGSSAGIFDFDNFRVCLPNSDCATAGDILYEAPRSAADPLAELTGTPFGDATSPAPSHQVVEFAPPQPPSPIQVTANTVTMQNKGSGTSNDSANGYLLAYQQLSGNFDVRVRADSQIALDGAPMHQYAKFGLEARASLADGADKIDWTSMWRASGQRRLQWLRRENGSTANSELNTGNTLPVWLRMIRDGDTFTLYYSYDTSAEPAENSWSWNNKIEKTISGMPEQIYLGLINSSASATDKTQVEFSGYHVCANQGEATSCGEVREADGLAVINAANELTNIERTRVWTNTSRQGKAGFIVEDGGSPNIYNSGGYENNAPQLKYAVDFTNPGTYYVWILGYSSNGNGNSLHFGPTNSPPNVSDNMSSSTTGSLVWFNGRQNGGRHTIDISSVGSTSLSVWMREDGFELYQILLTKDPGFNPNSDVDDPLSVPQSTCSAVGMPPIPPGMLSCSSLVTNGNFENTQLMSKWIYSSIGEQVTRTSLPHFFAPGESFSMAFPAVNLFGLPRRPWLYQDIQMPTWIITSTVDGGTKLNLTAHVAVNPEGAAEPDPFYVVLRNQTGQPHDADSVTGLVELATGSDTPAMDPNHPDPNNREWVFKIKDLATYFDPPESILDYADQPMRLFFESPNTTGNYSTRFYLDNVNLEACTQQPIPSQYSTKLGGRVWVFIDGVPTQQPGVLVWAYAIDGALAKTYTIHDSTFSLYDLPADPDGTEYVIYAEYNDNGITYFASTIRVLRPGETIDNIVLLLVK